mgnify:CR=1 FL=1
MLTAEPCGPPRVYEVRDESGRHIADVRVSPWLARGEIRAAGIQCKVRRDGGLFGTISLRGPEGARARAAPLHAFSRGFTLCCGERRFVLRSPSAWFREIRLLECDQVIGTAVPEGVWSSRAHFDLPETLPLELRLFVIWLALVAWRRWYGGSPSFTGTYQVAPWRS